MLETVLVFLETYSAELGAAAVIGGCATWVFSLFRKQKKTELAPETIDQIKPPQVKESVALTVPEFIRIRRELKTDLEAELAEAHDKDKTFLTARIAELQSQIDNPDEALATAQKRIADLEALLDRSGNDIGGDRINAAKDALEKGDYSLADDLFAEIEARRDMEVKEAARAAYGRGEVAEAEVRWADAAAHYVRSGRLDPSYRTLSKAHEFTHWAGNYAAAEPLGLEALSEAKKEEKPTDIAMAMNDLALTIKALGRFPDAEKLYLQAIETDKMNELTATKDHATRLNNLAVVVKEQGRYPEAEDLYREALQIDKATIGDQHPDYAKHLNNLALVVQAQGRYPEAEGLYREALQIGKATIGDQHPSYATHLNNLAGVVRAQGCYAEAEGLYREALQTDKATIGEQHPDYAIDLNNLAGVVQEQGRYAEAEGLFREALQIDKATIGDQHPDYATHLNNLALLLIKMDRAAEAEPLLRQALAIFDATLPPDHPHISAVKTALATHFPDR